MDKPLFGANVSPKTGTGASSFSPAISDAVNYTNWCIDQFGGVLKGRILEVGLGHASYYPMLKMRGQYVGVDIDHDLVACARKRFPEGDFRQVDVAKENFSELIGGASFDAVVCFNVLEHIEDDETVVKSLLSILSPAGRLCLLVPAMPLLFSDMDRFAGHHRRYSLSRLRILAHNARAKIVDLRYFNPVGGAGWLANKFFSHQSLADQSINNQIVFFDRYLIPFSRVLDPLFRGFFGQSAICVMEK